MNLLLDTHLLLWFLREPEKLPRNLKEKIEITGAGVMVSLATLWEIAIKVSLNKLQLPQEYEDLFPQAVLESGFSLLSIEPFHLTAVRRLPHHHRDPFDRLLIAQAQVEGLTLVSRDPYFPAYDVSLLW